MLRKARAAARRRRFYRALLEGGVVNLTEVQIDRLLAVGEDVEIIFGHLDWPGVCHVRLQPPANPKED